MTDFETVGDNRAELDNDLIQAKLAHLKKLRMLGIDPYPAAVEINHNLREARELWSKRSSEEVDEIIVGGRIIATRNHGGMTFVDIVDGFDKLQLMIQKSKLGDRYDLWALFDLGDFVQVKGKLFLTKQDELTLNINDFKILCKTVRPLPDKWSGLEDTEIRYRERYADLIANPEVREKFILRSKAIQELRQILLEESFIEVETPILQSVAGGTSAKPFVTHYNAYNADVYLRIAPELYLKRLVIGGFDRVFEFAKNFRNEGVDYAHNPEFSELEFYVAYWDYYKLMEFTEKILRRVINKVVGKTEITFRGQTIDFEKPFVKISFRDSVLEATGIDISTMSEENLRREMKKIGLSPAPFADFGKLCDEIYKAKVRDKMIQPTFLIDHPIALSPLAKRKDNFSVRRFQLVVAGEIELCNAWSELNDPDEQQERFNQQVINRQKGDEEAHPDDSDYIKALEYGLPPTAGFGLGIDRLIMLMTDSPVLREVILFPYMRPKKESR